MDIVCNRTSYVADRFEDALVFFGVSVSVVSLRYVLDLCWEFFEFTCGCSVACTAFIQKV